MDRIGHVAMFGVPAHGHVRPGLPVIRELVDRGHRVSCATTEAFAPLVEAAGAEPVCYESTLPSESEHDSSWPRDPVGMTTGFLDEAIAVLPQLAAAFEHDRPDLLLYDIAAYPARILATRWRVPAVQLAPAFVPWAGFDRWVARLLTAEQRAAQADCHARFADWLAEQRMDLTVEEFLWRPQCGIALIPRALQPHPERVAAGYTFVGPCIDDHPDQDGWEHPDDGRPVLLISLGSVFTTAQEFYRQCIDAFGELDWHVVMAVGHHVDPAGLGPVPSNVEVHRWVPQRSVLSRATAFVTHAGMGGLSEGLFYGVPMVAVPQAVDQHRNATQLVRLGIGRHLRRDQVTAQLLREAVLGVAADAGVATRLASIREETRRSGGATAAADLIERASATEPRSLEAGRR